jgi:hypothetical protein
VIFHDILTGILLLGFGLTFGFLWLNREKWSTHWAKYPALVLFALAILSVLVRDETDILLPIVLLLAGIGLVVYTFILRKKGNQSK